MKKLSFALIFLILIFFIIGCTAQNNTENIENSSLNMLTGSSLELSKKQITKIVSELLQKANRIDQIFYGTGLPCENTDNITNPDANGMILAEVTDDRYRSTQDIKNAAETVFTKEVAKEKYYCFGFEGEYPLYLDKNGKLYINVNLATTGGITWLPETLEVISQTDTEIIVNIDNVDSNHEKYKGSIKCTNIKGEWRISDITEFL